MQAFTAALGDHVYRAELICYSSLLIVGVTQIIIQGKLPPLQPPWRIIGISLLIVLFGILLVPPILIAIRVWKRPELPSVIHAASKELTASPMPARPPQRTSRSPRPHRSLIARGKAMAAIPPDDDPDRARLDFSLSQLSVDRGDAEGKLRVE